MQGSTDSQSRISSVLPGQHPVEISALHIT